MTKTKVIPELKNLPEPEIQQLMDAPLKVSILVAGADDHIDQNEIRQTIRTARKNAKNSRSHLYEFYQEVAREIEKKLGNMLEKYPDSAAERNPAITRELEQINPILDKTNKTFAIVYYHSLKEIALKIAKSSGGVLGIGSIDESEKSWVDLPMLKDPGKLFD